MCRSLYAHTSAEWSVMQTVEELASAKAPLSREEYEKLSSLSRDQRTAEEDQQIVDYYLELIQRQPPAVPLFPTPPVRPLLSRAVAIRDRAVVGRLRQAFGWWPDIGPEVSNAPLQAQE